MNNTINLKWRGPFILGDKKNLLQNIPDSEAIYLFCFRLGQKDEYIINYVGETENINHRLTNHYKLTWSGKYSLLEFNRKEIDIIHYGEHDLYNINLYKDKAYFSEKMKAAIQNNLNNQFIFYAEPEYQKPLKNFDGKNELKAIEGAIQIHLYRKHETRQYILTPVSSYKLFNYTIINDFSNLKNKTIKGLEEYIKTPYLNLK